MSRSAQSARTRALLAAAATVALAGAATAYFYFTSGPSSDNHAATAAGSSSSSSAAPATPQNRTKSKRHIAVLVTQACLEHGLPISLLLEKYPHAVLLLAPDLVDLAHPRLVDQVPAAEHYRLIRCESAGALHVLKHLRPALAMLPPADVCGIGLNDLDNFAQQTEVISDESVARLLAA